MNTPKYFGISLIALSLLGIGCNPFASVQERAGQKIGEKVVEGMIEGSTGGKVNVGNELPSGFPTDLPRYSGGTILFATLTEAGKQATLSQNVEGEVETVFNWYDTTLKANGYVAEGSGTGFALRKFVKGDASIMISVFTQSSDDGKAYAHITAVYRMK